MKPVIAFRFEILPEKGETPSGVLDAVRASMTDWLRGLFRGFGIHSFRPAFDGVAATPHEGHIFCAEDASAEGYRLVRVEWEMPGPQAKMQVWRFVGAAACDARTIHVELMIHTGWKTPSLRPIETDLTGTHPLSTVAGLRDAIVKDRRCRVEGEALSHRARLIRKNNVDAFDRDVLRNPDRVLPVVLLVLGTGLDLTLDSLHNLQALLFGMGDVSVLMDETAAQRLTKLLGPEVLPPDAVMRIFWPKLLVEGWPQSHPYLGMAQLRENLREREFPSIPMTALAPVGAARFDEGPLVKAARAAVSARSPVAKVVSGPTVPEPVIDPELPRRLAALEAEARQAKQAAQQSQKEAEAATRRVLPLLDELAELREQLVELRAKVAEAAQRPDELAVEVERAWDENRRLLEDRDAERLRREEIEEGFRSYIDATTLSGPDDVEQAPPEDGRRFASVADALRSAAGDFADVLEVWEDAERSAAESSFAATAKVYQALRAIAEVGRAYLAARDGGPAVGPIDKAFLKWVPFKYTAFESPTTLSLFGSERVFQHRGRRRQMQRHLTLGGGTTNNCLQVYFEFDGESRRVLVGHCGRHLPYSSQRT